MLVISWGSTVDLTVEESVFWKHLRPKVPGVTPVSKSHTPPSAPSEQSNPDINLRRGCRSEIDYKLVI